MFNFRQWVVKRFNASLFGGKAFSGVIVRRLSLGNQGHNFFQALNMVGTPRCLAFNLPNDADGLPWLRNMADLSTSGAAC